MAQSVKDLKWYLDPDNQNVQIDIDDLHTENILANPELKWGHEIIKDLKLKKEVTIAIIDTGIDPYQPDLYPFMKFNSIECLSGNIIPPFEEAIDRDNNQFIGDCIGWNFKENTNLVEADSNHGTHVTGIMTSILKGQAEKIKLLPLSVYGSNEFDTSKKPKGGFLPKRIFNAFQYALDQKVDVIHLSAGWPKLFMSVSLDRLLRKIINEEIIIVSAAGNSSQVATIYPCNIEGVVCVGSVSPSGKMSDFSNFGSQVDIFAPGEKILSSIPLSRVSTNIDILGFDYMSGTSQAAPFISASLAILKSLFPEESADEIRSRMFYNTTKSFDLNGLNGYFNLGKSILSKPKSFYYPMTKGLDSIEVHNRRFEFSLTINNLTKKSLRKKLRVNCSGAKISKQVYFLKNPKEVLNISGILNDDKESLTCSLEIEDQQDIDLSFKLAKILAKSFEKVSLSTPLKVFSETSFGMKSKLIPISPINQNKFSENYNLFTLKDEHYIFTPKGESHKFKNEQGCKPLRFFQTQGFDQKSKILIESLCLNDKKNILSYQFRDSQLKLTYPMIYFEPSKFIINYNQFTVKLDKSMPTISFIQHGPNLNGKTGVWDKVDSSQARHLYELVAMKKNEKYWFDSRQVDHAKTWKIDLGLRYLPRYDVLFDLDSSYIISINDFIVSVNKKTHLAKKTNLSKYLLIQNIVQKIPNSQETIFQSLITPYSYRGKILDGIDLRFEQIDRRDPIVQVLSTFKTDKGYSTILKTFKYLLTLNFDAKGNLNKVSPIVLDRFDFIGSIDKTSGVQNLIDETQSIQSIDGSKIHTNFISFNINGKFSRFKIPNNCSSIKVVKYRKSAHLALGCIENKSSVFRYINLKI